eukprot:10792949-Alexandrium_andersonii.AAC.1
MCIRDSICHDQSLIRRERSTRTASCHLAPPVQRQVRNSAANHCKESPMTSSCFLCSTARGCALRDRS